MRRLTNLDARVDAAGWLVTYPDGTDGHWNDGRGGVAARVDDVSFAVGLVEHLVEVAGADADRVYATGMSNGAMFCHRLAAERPDVVAAFAPVAGTLPEPLLGYKPNGPVPVLMVHGSADPIVAYQGGTVAPGRGQVASVDETAAWWRTANRAAEPATVEELAEASDADPTRVHRATWAAGPGGGDVVVVTVDGGGHTWPGGLQYLPRRVIGRTTTHVHASDLVVAFFSGQLRGR